MDQWEDVIDTLVTEMTSLTRSAAHLAKRNGEATDEAGTVVRARLFDLSLATGRAEVAL